jgi:hypothetical protein
MFTHTKTEVDCSPGASTVVVKRRRRPRTTRLASGRSRRSRRRSRPTRLSRAGTLTAMDSAPKRKRSGITSDSCGKAGDPHNLEGRALAFRNSSISIKRRRTLDAGWDLAADESGSRPAAPRFPSSLLKYAQAGTRPAPGGHTDLVKW